MKKVLFVFVLFFSLFSHAQSIKKHQVKAGETVTSIAKDYKVTPADIYRLNPDAKAGLKPEMTLLIQTTSETKGKVDTPKKTEETPKKIAEKTHTVSSGETIYSIAKKYGTSETELLAANPNAKNGIQPGDVLVLKAEKKNGKSVEKATPKTETSFHIVEPKETKYGIAKKYGMSVTDLEALNPEIKSGLQIGFRLKIKPGTYVEPEPTPAPAPEKPVEKEIKKTITVAPKETLYGLSKKYKTTVDELIALNPELKNGLQEGMSLVIPDEEKSEPKKVEIKSANKSVKLAVLIPFNLDKIDADSIPMVTNKLKADRFLNMTLDFYSGVAAAIDSLKQDGVTIDVSYFDSGESKQSSKVAELIKSENLASYDAVIGPFYQNHVEKTCELLAKSKTLVVSPLSKDYDKKFKNLVQTMPDSNVLRDETLEFLYEKDAKILAIVEPKKVALTNYLKANYKDIVFIPLTEKGGVTKEMIQPLLHSTKVNYIIFESERTGLALNFINALNALATTHKVTPVTLDKNETFDYEEISIEKLAKLGLITPSVTTELTEDVAFRAAYRSKYKSNPTQFAVRGFDLTIDLVNRLAAAENEKELFQGETNGLENRFKYENSKTGARNSGIYILQYQPDLTVKTIN